MRQLVLLMAAMTVGAVVCGETIEMKAGGATCTLVTQGARIVSYATQEQGEFLWNDAPAQLTADAWAHGGIPVCWPWFSRNKALGGKIHGFAWERPFRVVRRSETAAASETVLQLDTPEASLVYTVRLTGAALRLTLETINVGGAPFRFSAAWHPYFRVGMRDKTWLKGVRAAPFAVTTALDGNVAVPEKTGRVYEIADPVLNRTLVCTAEGSGGVCTWNPGANYADVPGKLPPDAWRHYVCVEPTAGYPGGMTLPPGGRHRFSYTLAPRPCAAGARVLSENGKQE